MKKTTKKQIKESISLLEKQGYKVEKDFPRNVKTFDGYVDIRENGTIDIYVGDFEGCDGTNCISKTELEEFRDKIIPMAIRIRDGEEL